MVRRYGALAGVNASFFHYTGLPLGLLVENAVMVSVPVYDRTALVVLDDGSAGMDRVGLNARVTIGDNTSIPVNGFNRTLKKGEVIAYNTAFGAATPKVTGIHELVLKEGAVIAIGKGNTPLTPGVTVVASEANSKLKSVQVGAQVVVMWDLELLENRVSVPGYRIQFAVGGGPRLVSGGKVKITSAAEQFRSDITQGRAPRTALGITADGAVLLVTVNGRQPGVSVGMTLDELAHLMIELGAIEAMNLDGGGSTTMVVRDKVVNIPSDGGERAVSSALLLYAPGDEYEFLDRKLPTATSGR
jgi:hypothetical protein